MLDSRFIGHAMPPFEVDVEASRLRFFAKATGQTDPVYIDDDASRAAGHRALPVPPTFLFCLEMSAPNPEALRELLGIEVAKILHGERRQRIADVEGAQVGHGNRRGRSAGGGHRSVRHGAPPSRSAGRRRALRARRRRASRAP